MCYICVIYRRAVPQSLPRFSGKPCILWRVPGTAQQDPLSRLWMPHGRIKQALTSIDMTSIDKPKSSKVKAQTQHTRKRSGYIMVHHIQSMTQLFRVLVRPRPPHAKDYGHMSMSRCLGLKM